MNKFNRQTDSKRIFTLFVKFTNRVVNVTNGHLFFSFLISGLSFTFYFTHIFYWLISLFFTSFHIFDNFLFAYFTSLFYVSHFVHVYMSFTYLYIGKSYDRYVLSFSLVSYNYSHFARFLHLFPSY